MARLARARVVGAVMTVDRNQRERDRLRAKRKNPEYLKVERRRQKARMRKRRQRKDYQQLERDERWWK